MLSMNFHANEVAALLFEERVQSVKIGADQSERRGIPTIAHVGYSGTAMTVKLAKAYEDAGVDCVCLCTPYPVIT